MARGLHYLMVATGMFSAFRDENRRSSPNAQWRMTMSDIKDTLKNAGHKVAEKAGQAADWVKEKTGMGEKKECGMIHDKSDIREHMDVIASCGTKVGVVDHIEGGAVKLTKK